MNPILRRLIFVIVAWVTLKGDAIISCSSDPGGISSANRPPVASDSFYSVPEDGSATGFMQATDPDGDSLVYRVTAPPGTGTLVEVDTRTGQFTYRPDGIGTDSFSFRASDGRKDSNTGVVTIRVEEQAAAPGAPGVVAVVEDPLRPDALLVVWPDEAGTLERVYGDPALAPETLARDVASVMLDPSGATGIVRIDRNGHRQAIGEGGYRKPPVHPERSGEGRPRSRRADDGDGRRLPPRNGTVAAAGWRGSAGIVLSDAGDGRRLMVTGDGGRSWAWLPPAGLRPGSTVSLWPDRSRSSRWWLAESDEVTRLLVSDDDGQSWRVHEEALPPGLRLVECSEDRPCLMDAERVHLWRPGHSGGPPGVNSLGHAGY
jgi:hypothetical protein